MDALKLTYTRSIVNDVRTATPFTKEHKTLSRLHYIVFSAWIYHVSILYSYVFVLYGLTRAR